jgi:hypothetical protein
MMNVLADTGIDFSKIDFNHLTWPGAFAIVGVAFAIAWVVKTYIDFISGK